MTDHEAARLAEIRARHDAAIAPGACPAGIQIPLSDPCSACGAGEDDECGKVGDVLTQNDLDIADLLTMLDAAARPHDAEFVTRAMYDEVVAAVHRMSAEVAERLIAQKAAERDRDKARQALREPWGVMLGRAECAEQRVSELLNAYEGKSVIELVAERNASRQRAEQNAATVERVAGELGKAEAACARHVTAYDEVARRVAEVEAALRIAEPYVWVAYRKADSEPATHRDWECVRAALRPAEEKPNED